MPELPEVETMVSSLRGALLGRMLEEVKVLEQGVLRDTSPDLLKKLKGCRIVGLTRRGKFLLFHLSNGSQLLFHLKMTGRLVLADREQSPGRWERLHMEFKEWDRKVTFEDQRKFGYLAVVPEDGECPVDLFYDLGPDALTVSLGELKEILRSSRRPVKALLLDQRALAGLGNIYVDESLHRAGIHPLCPAAEVTDEQAERLHRAVGSILNKAIACGGSSVRSFLDSRGRQGTYQEHHRVYRRKGGTCRTCGETIAYGKMASRGTHYCPACQQLPASSARRTRRRGTK